MNSFCVMNEMMVWKEKQHVPPTHLLKDPILMIHLFLASLANHKL